MFNRELTDGQLDTTNGTDTFVYTFNYWNTQNNTCMDATIIGNTLKDNEDGLVVGVCENIINVVRFYDENSEQKPNKLCLTLPNNVFLTRPYAGTYYAGCHNNTLGNDCHDNTFGHSCNNNTLGSECNSNEFGADCNHNILGVSCENNTFGIGNSNNAFGHSCSSNTLVSDCNSNTFGNTCVNIRFLKNHTDYVTVEDSNKYINLTSTQTTSPNATLTRITIAQGTNNTTTVKTISHNTLNDTFRTVYQPVNSVTVSV